MHGAPKQTQCNERLCAPLSETRTKHPLFIATCPTKEDATAIMRRQLFFSHTHRADDLGRPTHARTRELAREMRGRGYTTWIDESEMLGDVDASMASGIDEAMAILVCVTREYVVKVNESARDPHTRDNCLSEFSYSQCRRKLMLPVIMEPCMLLTSTWPPGIVPMHLSNRMYVDASGDSLAEAARTLSKMLCAHGVHPSLRKAVNAPLSRRPRRTLGRKRVQVIKL